MSQGQKLLKSRPVPDFSSIRKSKSKPKPEYVTLENMGRATKQSTGGGGLGADENEVDYQGDKESLPEITVTDAGKNGGRPIMNDPEIMVQTDPAFTPSPLSAPGNPKREQMRPGKSRK